MQNKSDGTYEPLRIGKGQFACVFEVIASSRGVARIALCQVDNGANAPAALAAHSGGSSFSLLEGEHEGEFCLFDRASGIRCKLRVFVATDFHDNGDASTATVVTLSECYVLDAEQNKMRCVVAELSMRAGDADGPSEWTPVHTCLPSDPVDAPTSEERARAGQLLRNAFHVRRAAAHAAV